MKYTKNPLNTEKQILSFVEKFQKKVKVCLSDFSKKDYKRRKLVRIGAKLMKNEFNLKNVKGHYIDIETVAFAIQRNKIPNYKEAIIYVNDLRWPNRQLDDKQATILHELSHVICGHLNDNNVNTHEQHEYEAHAHAIKMAKKFKLTKAKRRLIRVAYLWSHDGSIYSNIYDNLSKYGVISDKEMTQSYA